MESAVRMRRKLENGRPGRRLEGTEAGVVDLFSGMAGLFGMPPSIGAIYALLFISEEPLCQDDLIERLGISKGSASQGLAVLRRLGALRSAASSGRREYFSADLELKKLVGAFLRSEVIPQIDRGRDEAKRLLAGIGGRGEEFLEERLEKLDSWLRRGRQVLGLLHRFLD